MLTIDSVGHSAHVHTGKDLAAKPGRRLHGRSYHGYQNVGLCASANLAKKNRLIMLLAQTFCSYTGHGSWHVSNGRVQVKGVGRQALCFTEVDGTET